MTLYGPVTVSMENLVSGWPEMLCDKLYQATGRKVIKYDGQPWHNRFNMFRGDEYLYKKDALAKYSTTG